MQSSKGAILKSRCHPKRQGREVISANTLHDNFQIEGWRRYVLHILCI